jgi:hypothetical protein
MSIQSTIAGIKGLCGSVKQGVAVMSLLVRLKSWVGRFVGVDNLLRDEGRLWINEGFVFAGEGAAMTPTPIDDAVIARCKKVIASPEGFAAAATLIHLSFDIPDIVSGSEEDSIVDEIITVSRQVSETDTVLCGEDQTAEDPLTVLTIIYVCLQIARLIRTRAETRRERRENIKETYNAIGKNIARKLVIPAAVGSRG